MFEALAAFAVSPFGNGIISAISLPIGAALGLAFRPGHTTIAGVMAFGAGALLTAVSFELIEPAFETAHSLTPLAIGFIVGASVFVLCNAALDQKGGFLRHGATIGRFIRGQKQHQTESMLETLSGVGILRALPPEEVQAIVPYVRSATKPSGTVIVQQGEAGDALYLVVSGEVNVTVRRNGTEESIAQLKAGDTFGEMALLTGEPRNATIEALTEVELLEIDKEDFDRLVSSSPRLELAVHQLASERAEARTAVEGDAEAEARRWRRVAMRSIEQATLRATAVEEREVAAERGGAAAVGIYLGLFLDGIPESLAIGALLVGGHGEFNVALIGAIFLANFPEAMSSSVLMSHIGYGVGRIMAMWGGLMLFTGVGAIAGSILFAGAPPALLAGIFAMAAGAMLAMLAQTAMPEAFEQGGWVVGISTVLGFLAAFSMAHGF